MIQQNMLIIIWWAQRIAENPRWPPPGTMTARNYIWDLAKINVLTSDETLSDREKNKHTMRFLTSIRIFWYATRLYMLHNCKTEHRYWNSLNFDLLTFWPTFFSWVTQIFLKNIKIGFLVKSTFFLICILPMFLRYGFFFA